MTDAERQEAVARFGFTSRQAAFLTTVLLHGGVCVQRQYRRFARIAHGQVTHDFFAALTNRRLATAYPCARAGTQVFHVHHKGLYRAIGEPDSRYRRRGSVARAIEHLMLLDAVLATPDVTWLATEREKVRLCLHRYGLRVEDLPALTFDAGGMTTTRYFPHKRPMGVRASGDELTLLYLATEPEGKAFRTFLNAHRRIVQRLPRWRILVALPRGLVDAYAAHRRIVADLCAPPLRPAVADELRWYCYTRRAIEEGARRLPQGEMDRYAAARRAFGVPRFFAAYRRWCHEGDACLLALQSPTWHDAWDRSAAVCESLILPHAYGHLAPLGRTA